MTRLTRRAFTLVELLVVMSVIAVLVALLMPGLATVWKTVHVTQCMSNLGTLYKAQQAWRNENNSTLFAGGGDWAVKLASYVTNDSVFNCPEGWESSQASGGSGSWSGGGSEEETSDEDEENEGRPEDFIGDSFSFDVYDGPSFQNKLWNVSINSEWARRTQVGRNDYRYQIEDLGYIGGGDRDFKDIDVVVKFVGSTPSEVTLVQGKHGSQAYRFDLIINGKVAVHNIDEYASTHNVGEYVPPDPSTWNNTGTGGSTYGKSIYVGHYYKQSDYGLSRGSYEILERDVPAVDSKLFLILDYGKSLADYTNISVPDPWNKYFFTDVEEWDRTYNVSGELHWRKYFSLRHFERANVLFCDGHVEGLSADDLRSTNPLWKYTGL